jgi:hypothetical protein
VQTLLEWKSNKLYILGERERERESESESECVFVCVCVCVCVCSLSYLARNTHASYCHLSPARQYNIFPHYLIKGTIFE